jgi:hypothetical protein
MVVVDRFLRDHIASLAELELLLELRRRPEHGSTGPELATDLALSESVVGDALDHLRASRLAEPDDTGRWRYHADAGFAEIVDAVDRAFGRDRVEILRLLSTQAMERIRRAAARSLVGSRSLRQEPDDG